MKVLRNIFLITLCCFAFVVAQNAPAPPGIHGKPLYTAELGVAPYTFRNMFPKGVEATLDSIKMLGFTSIEGGGAGMDAYEYKKLCAERGLKIPAMGAQYDMLLNNPLPVIERAKIYGAEYIMCSWIPHTTGSFNLKDAQKAVTDFNKIGKTLADSGLTFCYHAHGYEFQPYENGSLLDYIMENTDPAYVSFEMDIFWIQFGGGNPAALLRKYPNRWKMMHLKDMQKGVQKDLTGATNPEHSVTLGQGELDIPEILRAAREIGIKHYFIEDESSRIMTQIPQSIKYLKSLKE
jgi:sugar phosphate isomerase/epimerase